MVLMRGPTALRYIVTSYVANEFTEYLEMARDQWGLNEFTLPTPVQFDSYEPFNASTYPIMGMYVVSDSDHKRVDYSAKMEEEFESQYACRIFCAVLSPTDQTGAWEEPVYPATMRCRDDMTTALRAFLLTRPSFGHSATLLDEGSINTDYPELMRVKSQSERWIGAGIVSAQIRFTESLYRDQIGTVNTYEVHPAEL